MFPIGPAALACLIAAGMTAVILRLAPAVGLVDRPDGHRKLHLQPIPLGGGIGILIAVWASLAAVAVFELSGASEIQRHPRFMLGLLAASALICLVGLIDDRFDLRGRQKLAAQVLAVAVIVSGGLTIERLELFGWQVELGLLATPFTALWLLGAINALNLIDGVDGLAGTVGVILSVTFAVLASMMGHSFDALLASILAGAIAGFLLFNLPPARIYLGDAGSMLIGLVLGVLAIRSSLKGPATVAMAAPTAIWAILAFDVLMAIMRRKLTGQSMYATDRSHLHHVLQKRGLSAIRIVAVIGALCAVCAAGALISIGMKSEAMALGTAFSVLAMLVVTGWFGRSECGLLLRRCQSLSKSMIRLPHQPHRVKAPVCSRFHGNREWELLWASLVEYAERFDLSIVQLNVSSPSIGEEYHAMWERRSSPPLARQWRSEIPLFQQNLSVGRLIVAGDVRTSTSFGWLSELIEGLRPFEIQLNALLDLPETDQSSEIERQKETARDVTRDTVELASAGSQDHAREGKPATVVH